MAYEFRPRGVGELVDATFRIYRAYWWTMVKSAAVILLPAGIIQAGFSACLEQYVLRFQGDPSPGLLRNLLVTQLILFVPLALYLLATIAADAVVVKETADACHGIPPAMDPAWRAARARLRTALGAGVLTYAIVFMAGIVTCCCLFLGALFITAFLAAVMPLVMLEESGAWRALGRSFSLLRDGFWRALGVLVVIFLLLLIPGLTLGFGLQLAAYGDRLFSLELRQALNETSLVLHFISTLLGTVLGALLAPLYSIGKTLIYFDQRVRQEGYDLERAVADLNPVGGGHPGAPAR